MNAPHERLTRTTFSLPLGEVHALVAGAVNAHPLLFLHGFPVTLGMILRDSLGDILRSRANARTSMVAIPGWIKAILKPMDEPELLTARSSLEIAYAAHHIFN